MAKRINKTAVDALSPGQTMWDSLSGFGCRCSKGGTKAFVLKYRVAGRQRWLTIGRYGGGMTVEDARKKAVNYIADIYNGGDPAALKVRARKDPTLAEYTQRYIAAKVQKRKPRTIEADRANLKNYILPKIGNLKLRAVIEKDIARLHDGMSATPYAANRVLSLLNHIFEDAERKGERPRKTNPCFGIERYTETPRERFLSREEMKALAAALHQEIKEGNNAYAVAAILLLLFTGSRVSEILTLEWRFINFERGMARLPDTKTGEHTIYLPSPAIQILKQLPKIDDNPYCIVGRRRGRHMINLQRPWQRIRARAGLHNVRLHDLRHSFASTAVTDGKSLHMTGKMLGHRNAMTTQRYAHISDDPLHQATEETAQTINSAINASSFDSLQFGGGK